MRQRVLIAIALACEPKLLIADEPTTALDVTIQAQVLEVLKELVADTDAALLMITHDLGVVAGLCDEVNVMYSGRIVESTTRDRLFADTAAPLHRRAAGEHPAARLAARRAAAPDPGVADADAPVDRGVRVRAPVPQQDRRLHHVRAAPGAPGRPRAALLQPVVRPGANRNGAGMSALVSVQGLKVHFPITPASCSTAGSAR